MLQLHVHKWSFIKLPKDLLIHSFTYLLPTDIHNLSLTAKDVKNICDDPNAGYHAYIKNESQCNQYQKSQRYIKTQSLHFGEYYNLKVFNHLPHLKFLTLSISPRNLLHFPKNMKLTLFKSYLICTSNDTLKTFLDQHLNPTYLQHLSLHFFNLSDRVLPSFFRFNKLKSLSLFDQWIGSKIKLSAHTIKAFKSLITNKKWNGNCYPFPSLQEISTSYLFLKEESTHRLFFEWIIINNTHRKTMKLLLGFNLFNTNYSLCDDMIIKILPFLHTLHIINSHKGDHMITNGHKIASPLFKKLRKFYRDNSDINLHHFQLEIDIIEEHEYFYRLNKYVGDIVKIANTSMLICRTGRIDHFEMDKLIKDCPFGSVSVYLENKYSWDFDEEILEDEVEDRLEIEDAYLNDEDFERAVINLGKSRIETLVKDIRNKIKYIEKMELGTMKSMNSFFLYLKIYQYEHENVVTRYRELSSRSRVQELIMNGITLNKGLNYAMSNNEKYFRFQCEIKQQ
eukprot:348361_1